MVPAHAAPCLVPRGAVRPPDLAKRRRSIEPVALEGALAPRSAPPQTSSPQTSRARRQAPSATVTPFRTGLESCGLAAEDLAVLVAAMGQGRSLAELRREIAAGTLLTKKTSHGRRHILGALRRRFMEGPGDLAPVADVAAVLPKLRSPVARAQLMLPYLVASDRAVREVLTECVIPRRRTSGQLPTQAVVDTLLALFQRDGRTPWRSTVCTRWARGLLSVLREVGAQERGVRREALLPYSVRSEVFCFHLWGLYRAGRRGRDLLEPAFWALLLLPDAPDIAAGLAAVIERGWWRSATVADIREIVPVQRSFEEWCDVLG